MWNRIRFVASLIKARSLNKNIPLCVGIHATSKCNFQCIYCYGVYPDKKDIEKITTEQILGLIDELHKMGTLWITLTGGEPLIRNDIEIIVDKIKKRNIICSINTNASLINEKINILKKIEFVTISLDGDEATNDLNRGRGTYRQIMDGIKCLKKYNIPFDATAVLTKNNLCSIDVLLDIADEIGFLTEFNFLQDQDSDNKDYSAYSLTDEEIKNTLKKLIRYKKMGKPIFYSLNARKYSLNWPVSYNKKILYEDVAGFKAIHCFMGKLMCHIDADGKVYPCIQLAGKFPALSFIKDGFKKAWEHLDKNKTCKSCYATCYAEFNQILGLAPQAWLNNIKHILKHKI